MKERLQNWGWPVLALGLCLYGLLWFYNEATKLKWSTTQRHLTFANLNATPLAYAQDSLFDSVLLQDTVPPQNPFGQPMPPRPKASTSQATTPTWVRPSIQLKGTVGSQAATLINSKGEKKILREGDYLDSVLVVRIQPGRVTLKDSHGTFEISSQE